MTVTATRLAYLRLVSHLLLLVLVCIFLLWDFRGRICVLVPGLGLTGRCVLGRRILKRPLERMDLLTQTVTMTDLVLGLALGSRWLGGARLGWSCG